MSFQLSISGLKELQSRIESLSSDLLPAIVGEMKASSATIASAAKIMAPVDLGFLRNSIYWNPVSDDSVEIVAVAEYAPYVEFGTGALVDVPAGLEEYAMTFKGAGLKKVNLPARPFLFPALAQERPVLIQNIIKVIDTK